MVYISKDNSRLEIKILFSPEDTKKNDSYYDFLGTQSVTCKLVNQI
jgi:hypothetical protein